MLKEIPMKTQIFASLFVVFETLTTAMGASLGTAFTYQGRLTDNGTPANGNYDLRFILYNTESNGSQVGNTLTNESVAVSNGLFSAALDFGTGVFDGSAY